LAVVTSAKAGAAATAANPPKAVMANAMALATNLEPLRTRLGAIAEGFLSLILFCLPS
jgi:hypothetical protein